MDIQRPQSILYSSAFALVRGASFPVRLRPICNELGVVSVRRKKLERGHALLVDATTNPKILLNSGDNAAGSQQPLNSWERFLVAHELGHLILHREKVPPPAGSREYWKIEFLCDAFARWLLLPETLAKQKLNGRAYDAQEWLRMTSALAGQARVPWLTAAFRASELGKRDVLFIRIIPSQNSGFKVLSTADHNRGVRRRIKPDSDLYKTVTHVMDLKQTTKVPPAQLNGLLLDNEIESAAAIAHRRELRLVICCKVKGEEPLPHRSKGSIG